MLLGIGVVLLAFWALGWLLWHLGSLIWLAFVAGIIAVIWHGVRGRRRAPADHS